MSSLTTHLSRKSDPIRAFLDERLVDFRPAREKWHDAQLGEPLVSEADSWQLIGTAIDHRIRMTVARINVRNAPEANSLNYGNVSFVLSELSSMLERHDGQLTYLAAEEETHLLQICYLLAMYEAFDQSSYSNRRRSPLWGLQSDAKWRAHLNRIPKTDINALQLLVKPALALFTLGEPKRAIIGPRFDFGELINSDGDFIGHLVSAEGDLIINNMLIEIKCTKPGFHASAVRQVITYSLLDFTREYKLTGCSIYLAQFGRAASWNLNELILEVSRGRYDYDALQSDFHDFLMALIGQLERKQLASEESQRRFAAQWQDVSNATKDLINVNLFDEDGINLARKKLIQATMSLRRLEERVGLDIHRD